MKEWRKVTFMKERLKAFDLTVILSYWELLYLFAFRNYGRLKKKTCQYKQISYSKSLLLLKGHFQSGLMYRVQCSITRVQGGLLLLSDQFFQLNSWRRILQRNAFKLNLFNAMVLGLHDGQTWMVGGQRGEKCKLIFVI